ncbi:hypothetical protein BC829DRAFT_189614 [Chytridium lagenaria]|nr:hypothetical protein BC829DRAFT_189614 [Chytridium lagenaria]
MTMVNGCGVDSDGNVDSGCSIKAFSTLVSISTTSTCAPSPTPLSSNNPFSLSPSSIPSIPISASTPISDTQKKKDSPEQPNNTPSQLHNNLIKRKPSTKTFNGVGVLGWLRRCCREQTGYTMRVVRVRVDWDWAPKNLGLWQLGRIFPFSFFGHTKGKTESCFL